VKRHPVSRRAAGGMTLVELMVGLAVGLFVSLIAISVFVSTRTLNVVNSTGARMGENARLAMEALQDDLRSAGFRGCQDPLAGAPVSQLNATDGFLVTDAGFAGYRGTGSGAGTSFAPALPAALSGLATPPSDDSDVVSVRVPVDAQGWGVTQTMATTSAAPLIGAAGPGAASTVQVGDIVLISDCQIGGGSGNQVGDIFQVTSMTAGTGSLGHVAGGASLPGNAVATLSRRYGDQASVYRLQTRHYYVAPSALPNAPAGMRSLWRLAVPCPECAANPQELAAGVERLSVTWGVDTDAVADQSVNRYFAADAVTAWTSVLSARVQMLVASAQNGVTQGAAASVAFAGSAVVPTDRRLRTVLTEVVTLRNRAP